MISLTVKALARYMTSGPSAQRRVLRHYKYPDPEGLTQAAYYRQAREAIVDYHQHHRDPAWLLAQAQRLHGVAQGATGLARVRAEHNARVLTQYARHFGERVYEVLPPLALTLTCSGVEIDVEPDLHVMDRRWERVIKLEFSQTAPTPEMVRIITQVAFAAVQEAGLEPTPAGVLYVDVRRGQVYPGSPLGPRRAKNIEDACQTIALLWPRL